jgi:hypothetical protein
MAFAGADAGQPPTPCATLPEGSTFPRARRRPYAVQGDPAQATALAAPSWVRGGANGHQPAGPALPASGTAAIAPRLQHGSTMRQHSTAVSPPTDNVGSRSSTPLAADESGYVPPRPARRGQRRCRLGPRCNGRSLGRLPDCAFVTSVARLARRRTARTDHRRLERSRRWPRGSARWTPSSPMPKPPSSGRSPMATPPIWIAPGRTRLGVLTTARRAGGVPGHLGRSALVPDAARSRGSARTGPGGHELIRSARA